MERKCSVCGSHMLYTPDGFRCSFCTNVEPLDSKSGGYGTSQSNIQFKTRTNKARNDSGKQNNVSDKRNRWKYIAPAVIIFVLISSFVSVLPILSAVFDMLKKEKQTDNLSVEFDGKSLLEIYEQEAEDTIDPEWFYEQAEMEKEIGNYTEDGFASETMKQAVEMMFGKSADEVTQDDLASILYLEFDTDGYSYERAFVLSYSVADYREFVPDGLDETYFAYGEEFESTIQTIRFPCDIEDNIAYYEEYENIHKDLHYFHNVRYLKVRDTAFMDYAFFENLSMVDCGYSSIGELLEANLNLQQIEILKVEEEDLTGIEQFTGLKKLYVSGVQTQQLELVAQCKMLDTLYCVALGGGMNYAPLGGLAHVKTLYIDGSLDGVKDLSVLASFKELENLTITKTEIISIDFLSGMDKLQKLHLSENGELENFEVLGSLTNLTHLQLDLNSLHGHQPNYQAIGNLKNLKSLSLNTVYELDFLYELSQLEELEVRLTFYDNLLELIRKMTNLKSLTLIQCHSQYPDGFACLKELKNLTKLTVENMEIDGAVDGLFAFDTLEELRIRNSKFYQAPTYVAVSDKLKILDLSYVEFITMPDSGEYYYVGYEDEAVAQAVLQNFYAAVALEELYLDGYLLGDLSGLKNLTNLKVLSVSDCGIEAMEKTDLEGCSGLEELNLSQNQISNISFVKNLPNLESLNIEGCYVADLTPLIQCPKLSYLNVKENPISTNPFDNINCKSQ